MVVIRALFLAFVTAIYILGGLHLFVKWADMKKTIQVQNEAMIELAKLSVNPMVEAQTNRSTGDVIVRINKNDKGLHYFPKLCPKTYEF